MRRTKGIIQLLQYVVSPKPYQRAHFIDTFQCRHLSYRIQTGANREHGRNFYWLGRPVIGNAFFTLVHAQNGDWIKKLTLNVVKTDRELHDDMFDVARRIVADELGAHEYCGSNGRLRLGKVQRQFSVGIEMLEEVLRIPDLHPDRGGVNDVLGRDNREGRAVGDATDEIVRALQFPRLVGIEEGKIAGRFDAHSRAGLFDKVRRQRGERKCRLGEQRCGNAEQSCYHG